MFFPQKFVLMKKFYNLASEPQVILSMLKNEKIIPFYSVLI